MRPSPRHMRALIGRILAIDDIQCKNCFPHQALPQFALEGTRCQGCWHQEPGMAAACVLGWRIVD
jgi:hypothetical protein